MARQRITTYTMLTPERWLELLEQIRARREAWIEAGLPSDSPEPGEEEEEREATMKDAEPEEEE